MRAKGCQPRARAAGLDAAIERFTRDQLIERDAGNAGGRAEPAGR